MKREEKILSQKCEKFLNGIQRIREELRSICCDSWSQQDLCGACAFGAYLVFKYAQHLGMNAKFRYSDNHCWCLVENVVVDITASQFWELKSHLDDKGILLTSSENIYQKEKLKCKNSTTEDNVIFFLTKHWGDQAPEFLLKRFGKRFSKKFSLPLPQNVGCTE